VVLDLDGVVSLPSSFWEEAMGGLIRAGFKSEQIKKNLLIETTDPDLRIFLPLAEKFVREAETALN
jgi:hypothetical protein